MSTHILTDIASAFLERFVSCSVACHWCITHAKLLLISELPTRCQLDVVKLRRTCTGQLTVRHQEATNLQCTARMYHQAMDECQRLQSENIALRHMLQNALENSPACRARSNSRGRNQAARGTMSEQSVLKPHMSFLAERSGESANHRRSRSSMLNRCACLQEYNAQCCTIAILTSTFTATHASLEKS